MFNYDFVNGLIQKMRKMTYSVSLIIVYRCLIHCYITFDLTYLFAMLNTLSKKELGISRKRNILSHTLRVGKSNLETHLI